MWKPNLRDGRLRSSATSGHHVHLRELTVCAGAAGPSAGLRALCIALLIGGATGCERPDDAYAAWAGTSSGSSTGLGDSTGDGPADSTGRESESESGGTATDAEPTCGNAMIEAPELCDDGNAVDGDGCNADCRTHEQELWSTQWGDGRDDHVNDLVIDADGNLLFCGARHGSHGNHVLMLVKLDAMGTELWSVEHAAEDEDDRWDSLAVHADGSVTVTGHVATTAVTKAYASDGQELWSDLRDGWGTAVVALPDGSTVVGGQVRGEPTWNAGLWHHNAAGAPTWSSFHEGDAALADSVWALAVDVEGRIVATGMTDGRHGEAPYSLWLSLWDTGGQRLWNVAEPSPVGGSVVAREVAVAPSGNIFVVGKDSRDEEAPVIFLKEYGPTGAALNTIEIDQSEGNSAVGVAVTADGGVVVVGSATKEDMNRDGFVAKYASDLTLEWMEQVDGPVSGSDRAEAVAIDRDGTVVVAGVVQVSDGEDPDWDVWIRRYAPAAVDGAAS